MSGRPRARAGVAVAAVAAAMAVAGGCAGDDAPGVAPQADRGATARADVPSSSTGTRPAPRPAAPRAPSRPRTAAGGDVLRAEVLRVVDGDTVQVESGGFDTTVRLIGIDTPETRHPSRPVECWGPEASALAARLMPPGARVRLRTDPTQDRRDRYGRLLAHVYAGDGDGARSVNRALVAAGAARVYVHDGRPFAHADAFHAAERAARDARRGLWGAPCDGDDRAASAPEPAAPAPPAAPPRCDPAYSGACVPPHPPDVDCGDVGRRVTVRGDDPHRLDGDGNGVGCERAGG